MSADSEGQVKAFFRAGRARHIDLALAGGAVGIEMGLLSDSLGAPGTPPAPITIVVSAFAGLLLLFHRRAPLIVLTVVLLLESVLAAVGAYPGGAPAVFAIALVALHEERRRSVPALGVTAIVLQVASISAIPVPVLAWGAGAYLQTRLRYVAALSERAEQLEREREQRDVIAAQNERNAIARELHDIVAHSVTVMLLGVRGARDTVHTDPDLAEEALRRVEKSGEESMAELRRMLLVLRGPTSDTAVDLAPAPTLGQVAKLVTQHRDSGMPVSLSILGNVREADPGVELTAYRIVQEGLTNVARHAQEPSQVQVVLDYGDEWLDVTVQDNGREQGTSVGGNGLQGLRERVVTTGGRLSINHLPLEGFRVQARLPLTGSVDE